MKKKYFLWQHKGFISIYGLILLQITTLCISLVLLQIITYHKIYSINIHIDLFIIEQIKQHEIIRNKNDDENQKNQEDPTNDENIEEFTYTYNGIEITFIRYASIYTINYRLNHKLNTIYVQLNKHYEIISFRYDYD